jgi:type III pantothenate kinase
MQDQSQIIVVDIGNSFVKLAVGSVDSRGTIELGNRIQLRHDALHGESLEAWAPKQPAKWFVASVHEAKLLWLFNWLVKHRTKDSGRQLHFTDLPLEIGVDAPEKVGIDRLLSAVAANRRRAAGSAAITITAGTAVTVNAISRTGVFLGGAILPGWSLQAKSLQENTSALPLVEEFAAGAAAIGKNTEAAIRSGICLGIKGAVNELIAQFRLELGDDAELLIAGGDAAFLRELLGRGELAPDLVLEGAAIVGFSDRVLKL